MLIVQGGPCGSTGPQPPCCDNTPPCGGGPPPPPGLPIDALVYLLFFFALVYGVYMMNKINNRQLAV
jgi:hypothetical protein